tara:strand:- start:376 stop:846 length:471 start_codon:yes stop_codon:yes gene_type:complete
MADLTVILKEDIVIDGHQYGGSKEFVVSGIADIYKRSVTVPASVDTTLVSFKDTVGGADSAMDIQNVKYIRVTNLDRTNSVNVSLQIDNDKDHSAADHSATILLEAEKSLILSTPHESIAVSDANATVITALVDLESILIDSGSNEVRMEIVVAST